MKQLLSKGVVDLDLADTAKPSAAAELPFARDLLPAAVASSSSLVRLPCPSCSGVFGNACDMACMLVMLLVLMALACLLDVAELLSSLS